MVLNLILCYHSPVKPTRPARAYLHLTKQEYLGVLSDKVRETNFVDAKASSGDVVLLGPPTVEFAPYGRVPSNRVRKDARQGTIDQDPEFIDFLESLTNPTTRPTPPDSTNDSEVNKAETMAVTPLIQFLRDKKVNKGKEIVLPAKSTKHARTDSKDNKVAPTPEKKTSPKNLKESTPPVDKRSATAIKVEKAARDAVKVLNKQANTVNKVPVASSVAATTTPSLPSPATPSASSSPVVERRRERGSASAAARILQRDLGIGINSGNRRRREAPPSSGNSALANAPNIVQQNSAVVARASEATNNTTPSPAATLSATVSLPSPSTPSTKIGSPSINSPPPTGPAASRSSPRAAASSPIRPSHMPTAAKPPSISPTSTQAFLKHANPSQGVTEPLLQEAFAAFGGISKVEIDKKKGFAYIDFAEPDGLQKAIKASPVKVAQGHVVVLERKTGPTLQARNTRGGGAMAGGRGGGMPMSPRGGRGGSVRGRGGIGRGNPNPSVGNTSQSTAAATASSTSGPNTAASASAPDTNVTAIAASATTSLPLQLLSGSAAPSETANS